LAVNPLKIYCKTNGEWTIVIEQVVTKKSPRNIILEHFKTELPISGGWGYTKDDACIINKNDPIVDPTVPFDGVAIEYVFAGKRIYEELIIFRPQGHAFSDIGWKLLQQQFTSDEDKAYDKLTFEIWAFPDKDWQELKGEWEGPNGHGSLNFDIAVHEKKRQEKLVRFTREFWFDITSFYGQGVVITDRETGEKTLFPPESFKFTDKAKKLFGIDE